jgi:hypothetical protein
VTEIISLGAEEIVTDEERAFLQQQLAAKFRWFNNGSRLWSAVYHWSLGVSAVTSGLAFVVIKFSWLKDIWPSAYEDRDDAAALFAALATIITAVSAAGNFGRKWQTNRISRGRVERLQIALSDPAASAAAIRDELQDIMKKHDEGIVGAPIK